MNYLILLSNVQASPVFQVSVRKSTHSAISRHRTRYVDFVAEDGCVALSSQCVSKQLLLCQRHSLHYTMILVNIAWSFALKGLFTRFSVSGFSF